MGAAARKLALHDRDYAGGGAARAERHENLPLVTACATHVAIRGMRVFGP